jgi:hypothetical protein
MSHHIHGSDPAEQGRLARLNDLVTEYVEHYHRQRNHQDLENRLIQLPTALTVDHGPIHCHARLGGTLNFYYRRAVRLAPIFGQHGLGVRKQTGRGEGVQRVRLRPPGGSAGAIGRVTTRHCHLQSNCPGTI